MPQNKTTLKVKIICINTQNVPTIVFDTTLVVIIQYSIVCDSLRTSDTKLRRYTCRLKVSKKRKKERDKHTLCMKKGDGAYSFTFFYHTGCVIILYVTAYTQLSH